MCFQSKRAAELLPFQQKYTLQLTSAVVMYNKT